MYTKKTRSVNSQQVFYRRAEIYHLLDSLFASPEFNALGQQTVVLSKEDQRLYMSIMP